MSVKLEIRRFPVNSMKNRTTYRKCLLLSGPDQVSPPDKADFTFVKKKQNPESQIAGNCEHIDDHNPQVGIRYKYTEYRADGKQYS